MINSELNRAGASESYRGQSHADPEALLALKKSDVEWHSEDWTASRSGLIIGYIWQKIIQPSSHEAKIVYFSCSLQNWRQFHV